MKNKEIIIFLTIINIILIGIIYSLVSKNANVIRKEAITIKEMTETEYDSQISELNKSHTNYADYVQTCKTAIASAITDMGIETSEEASVDTMVNNIRSISGDSNEISVLASNSFALSSASENGTMYQTTIEKDGVYVVFAGVGAKNALNIYQRSTSTISVSVNNTSKGSVSCSGNINKAKAHKTWILPLKEGDVVCVNYSVSDSYDSEHANQFGYSCLIG